MIKYNPMNFFDSIFFLRKRKWSDRFKFHGYKFTKAISFLNIGFSVVSVNK